MIGALMPNYEPPVIGVAHEFAFDTNAFPFGAGAAAHRASPGTMLQTALSTASRTKPVNKARKRRLASNAAE